jgi:hypothetical protein
MSTENFNPYRSPAEQSPDDVGDLNDESAVHLDGAIQQADWLDAHWLFRSRGRYKPGRNCPTLGRQLLIRLLFVIALNSVLPGLFLVWREPVVFAIVIPVGIISLLLLYGPIDSRRQQKRWGQQAGVFIPSTRIVSDSQVRVLANFVDSHFQWQAFEGYKRSDSVVLLITQRRTSFVILPKSLAQSDAHWRHVLKLVTENLDELKS